MANSDSLLDRILNVTGEITAAGQNVKLVSPGNPINVAVFATTLIGSALLSWFYGVTESILGAFEAVVRLPMGVIGWVERTIWIAGAAPAESITSAWRVARAWIGISGLGPLAPLIALSVVLASLGTVVLAFRVID